MLSTLGILYLVAGAACVAYYFLIGFALSRFITASYTNAVFDRFINPRIEGAKVNQGIHQPEEDDEDDIAEGETDD